MATTKKSSIHMCFICVHDAVNQRMLTTVHVVELGLRHEMIHVDGEKEQLAIGNHLEVPLQYFLIRVHVMASKERESST